MPLYVIERNFAEQMEFTQEGVEMAKPVIADAGNNWIFTFLSADKKKAYCLYESPNPDAIREAARRLGMPADVIMEVDEIRPDMFG
jgi:hypothetical protein